MRTLEWMAEPRQDAAPNRWIHAQAVGVAALTQLGYQLAPPLDTRLPFDYLACRVGGRLAHWEKVQVKGASSAGVVSLRRGDKKPGQRYLAGDFDLLLVVDRDQIYLIPYSAVQHFRSRFCVRDPAFGRFRLVPGCEPATDARPVPARRRARSCSETLPLFTGVDGGICAAA